MAWNPYCDDDVPTMALVSRLAPLEVTSEALSMLGAWHPNARPGANISMVRRVVGVRGWMMRIASVPTLIGIPFAWCWSGRFERFELTAIPARGEGGQTHVFIESSLSGRAGARVQELVDVLRVPATTPLRRNVPGDPAGD